MDMDEFWRSLGIGKDYKHEDVKKAYRALVQIHHPDKGGDSEKFRRIHHAYKMLTDPHYSYRNENKIHPVIINVVVTVEQLVFGATITSFLTKDCYPTTGVDVTTRDAIAKPKLIQVTDIIPAKTFRTPFQIIHNQIDFGDKKVDVLMNYFIDNKGYFKISQEGYVYVEIDIDVAHALKGGSVEVKTLFGLRKLRIPAGTMPGSLLRIKKHGDLPDLIVNITGFIFPDKQKLQSDPKYKAFEIDWDKENDLDRKEQEELDDLFRKHGGPI